MLDHWTIDCSTSKGSSAIITCLPSRWDIKCKLFRHIRHPLGSAKGHDLGMSIWYSFISGPLLLNGQTLSYCLSKWTASITLYISNTDLAKTNLLEQMEPWLGTAPLTHSFAHQPRLLQSFRVTRHPGRLFKWSWPLVVGEWETIKCWSLDALLWFNYQFN